MWVYEKRLQFPVNIKEPNAKMAQFIMSQYGGPDGEMGASMRYLSQRYSMPYGEQKAVLTDIGRARPPGDRRGDRSPAHEKLNSGGAGSAGIRPVLYRPYHRDLAPGSRRRAV